MGDGSHCRAHLALLFFFLEARKRYSVINFNLRSNGIVHAIRLGLIHFTTINSDRRATKMRCRPNK